MGDGGAHRRQKGGRWGSPPGEFGSSAARGGWGTLPRASMDGEQTWLEETMRNAKTSHSSDSQRGVAMFKAEVQG